MFVYLYEGAKLYADKAERRDRLQQLRTGQHAVAEAGLQEVVVPFQNLVDIVHLETQEVTFDKWR